MVIKIWNDYLLIRPQEEPTLVNGVYLPPDRHTGVIRRAKVIAAPASTEPGFLLEHFGLNYDPGPGGNVEGKTVLFNITKTFGPFKIAGVNHYFIKPEDVFGVEEEEILSE